MKKMKLLQCLMHSLFAVYVCSTLFACGQIYDQPTCSLTIPRDMKLHDRLDKIFDRDSNTIILEYTVKIRQDSGDCVHFTNSDPDSYQPWKWYRTQGVGSSHVLQTFVFYFGLLKTILDLGIEKVEICLDAYPPGCLHGYHFETTNVLVRDFLLRDLDIKDESSNWAVAKADTVEICAARIYNDSGRGNLVYRCCSYNKWKEIICDDDSADGWALLLNIYIFILSGLLPAVVVLFDIHQTCFGKESNELYKYTPVKAFSILICNTDCKETYPVIDGNVLGGMEKFKAIIGELKKDTVVTITEASLNVYKDQLLTDGDGLFFICESCSICSSCRRKVKEKLESCLNCSSCCRKIKEKVTVKMPRASTIILIFLSILSTPFFVLMFKDTEFNNLLDAFNNKELTFPLYLRWPFDLETKRVLCKIFIPLYLIISILSVGCSCYISCNRLLKKIFKSFWSLLSFISAALGTIFTLSSLIMIAFTVIVQVQIWTLIIQVIVTLLIYVISQYNNFWRDHITLKKTILKLFQSECWFKADKTVTSITVKSLDDALKTLNNGTNESTNRSDKSIGVSENNDIQNAGYDQPSEIQFDSEHKRFLLLNKSPFVFLDEKDVPFMSRQFYSRCLNIESRDIPKKISCKALRITTFAAVTASFISLVVISVFAYGDIYHISPSNRFFISFITTILPLLFQHVHAKGCSMNSISYLDRRFYAELRKAIAGFEETVIVKDFTQVTCRDPTPDDENIKLKLKFDFKTNIPAAITGGLGSNTKGPGDQTKGPVEEIEGIDSEKNVQVAEPNAIVTYTVETKPASSIRQPFHKMNPTNSA